MILKINQVHDLYFALDEAIQNSIRYVSNNKLSKDELEKERRVQALCIKLREFIQPLHKVMIDELPF